MNKLKVPLTGILAALLVLGMACAGGGDSSPGEEATPARTEHQSTPKPTREPTPSPTPAPAAGWTRHTTAGFEIDLPDTWETWEPTAEGTQEVIQALEASDPDLAEALRQLTSEEALDETFAAFDTESGAQFLTNFSVYEQESPIPMTVRASVSEGEAQVEELGGTLVASDANLSIGGARAGRIEYSLTCSCGEGPEVELVEVYYVVLPEPTHGFLLAFASSAADYPAMEPVFVQIAESFQPR
jgi:hypothetical protein